MAFVPINIFMAAIFLFGVAWGWEGQEERQFFAILSSVSMFSLWLQPLYSVNQLASGTLVISVNATWLPTFVLFWLLWWNVALMYFTGAHLMQTMGYTEPVGNYIKNKRKVKP